MQWNALIGHLRQMILSMGEVEYVRPDGAIRNAQLNIIPLSGNRIFGIAHDITESKQAKEPLIESRQKISGALEFNNKILLTSSIGILTYKESGQCVSANSAAAMVGGTTVEQLLTQNFHKISSWDKSGIYQAAIRALETGIEQLLEADVVTTFGKNVWLNLSYMSFDSVGERYLLVFTTSITERKKAAEVLIESENKYRELVENLRQNCSLKFAEVLYTIML